MRYPPIVSPSTGSPSLRAAPTAPSPVFLEVNVAADVRRRLVPPKVVARLQDLDHAGRLRVAQLPGGGVPRRDADHRRVAAQKDVGRVRPERPAQVPFELATGNQVLDVNLPADRVR